MGVSNDGSIGGQKIEFIEPKEVEVVKKQPNQQNKIESNNIYIMDIPLDNYTCYKCQNIPEILGLRSDDGYIDFNCPIHQDTVSMKAKDYFTMQARFIYFMKECDVCKKRQSDNKKKIFKYCYICKENLCPTCFAIHYKEHKKSCIDINDKSDRCPNHFSENNCFFCKNCKVNFCNQDQEEHKNCPKNDIIELKSLIEEAKKKIEIVKSKRNELKTITKIYDSIIESFNNHSNNYYHCTNIINLALQVKEDKDFEEAIHSAHEEVRAQRDKIRFFKSKFNVLINPLKTKEINISNQGFDNKDLEKLCSMKLKCLEKLILNYNELTSIEALGHLDSPMLKEFQAKCNYIEDIKPLKEINKKMPKLEQLNLSSNNISDISVLGEVVFKNLSMISLQNNNIDHSLKKVQDIYEKRLKGRVKYKPTNFEDFCDKYLIPQNLMEKNVKEGKLLLSGYGIKDEGLSILAFINYDFRSFKEIDFSENGITSIESFSKFKFDNVKILSLAFNHIKDIKVLQKVNTPKLRNLNIMSNRINDISVLTKIAEKCKNLKRMTIVNNEIRFEEEDIQRIITELKEKSIDVFYRVEH